MIENSKEAPKPNTEAASKPFAHHELIYWCIFGFLALVLVGVCLWYIFGVSSTAVGNVRTTNQAHAELEQSIVNTKQYIQEHQTPQDGTVIPGLGQ